MPEWLHLSGGKIWWIAGASFLTFAAFLIAAPLFVVRIPADYFASGKRPRKLWARRHPALRAALLIGKNALGLVFLLAGLAMLVLPGQGVLTILAGLMLLDFPGKHKLVRWVVGRPGVLGTLNWLRRRAGRPPLYLEG